jgi:hypothetical protein
MASKKLNFNWIKILVLQPLLAIRLACSPGKGQTSTGFTVRCPHEQYP